MTMKLTLGPVLYYWPRTDLEAFYQRALDWPLDCIYLGETVCSKRRALRPAEWIELGRQLAASGRQVVLSTLTLLEAESELSTLARLCDNGELLVEANDIAAVELLRERGMMFVGGPALNVYNVATLRRLHAAGLRRWVPPVEYDRDSLSRVLGECADTGLAGCIETEVFGYGRLPLAWSARCFTARAHNLPKDNCQFVCLDHPQGLPLSTQDGEHFLTLNGIQTQSATPCNLLSAWQDMAAMGVDFLRISPLTTATGSLIKQFRAVLDGRQASPALEQECNGYWFGQPGMATVTARSRNSKHAIRQSEAQS